MHQVHTPWRGEVPVPLENQLSSEDHPDGPPTTERLLASLNRWTGATCPGCSRRLCGHQVLFAIALGVGDRPRCLDCLAGAMAASAEDMGRSLYQHFLRRDCYTIAWKTASEVETAGARTGGFSACDWTQNSEPPDSSRDPVPPTAGTTNDQEPPASVAATWDAGSMACGELLLELRLRLKGMQPGEVLRLISLDSGAREDIPAWCRLTGHRLVCCQLPEFWIERRLSP